LIFEPARAASAPEQEDRCWAARTSSRCPRTR